MPYECPKCRLPLLEGPTSVYGPVEWACPSCGNVLGEDPASWQARQSGASSKYLTAELRLRRLSRTKGPEVDRDVLGDGEPPVDRGTSIDPSIWHDVVEKSLIPRGALPGSGFGEFEASRDGYTRWQQDGSARDLDAAEQHLRFAAEQGEELAYPFLGEIALARGRQVEAARWFRKADAADIDEGEARTKVAQLRGAVSAAAAGGDPEAQCEVAEWFRHGHGVPRNIEEATDWLRKAADQGHSAALHQLAVSSERGEGVPRDPTAALALYQRAADAGHPDAQYRLAEKHAEGRLLPKDDARAREWLAQAAAQGHLQALAELAEAKLHVDDYAGAVPLLQRAAARGHARAQYSLSLCYRNGEGLPQDDGQAVEWLRRSACQSDPFAECHLGQRYRDGDGVQRDEVRAVHWLRRAGIHGDEEARSEIADLLAKDSRNETDLRKAAYWFLRAASGEEGWYRASGQCGFAQMCESGRGMPQSEALAMKWYLMAAEGSPLGNAAGAAARARIGALIQAGRGFRSDDWLDVVEVLSRAARVDATGAAPALNRLTASDPRASAFSELLDLIGMAEVKETARNLVAMVSVDQMRLARGLRVPATSLHCVFSGPPGTGKTTVARIMGKLLGALGLLSSGHVKEVDRAGLVGRYVGETAQKVSEVIQDALGGVLFIDEAYSLTRADSPSDYGYEALDTLVKRMEDHRSDLVVIVAGYEEEMAVFLQANTGLQSRFPWQFRLPHYSAAELLELFKHLATKDGMRLETACSQAAHAQFAKHAGRDRSFGNGRFVRTLYEKARFQQAQRLVKQGSPTDDELQTLRHEDLPIDAG